MPPKKKKMEDRKPTNYSDVMLSSFTMGEVSKFSGFKKFYVRYNNDQPYLKTTKLRCSWDWDKQYPKQYYLTMSFDGYTDEGSKVEKCYNVLTSLDAKIKKHIEINCKSMLGVSRTRLKNMDKWYNSIMYKKGQYPPTMKVKASKDKQGNLTCQVYEYPNMDEPIDDPGKINMRGRYVVASLELTGVWYVDRGDAGYFTPSFKLHQLVILPIEDKPPKPKPSSSKSSKLSSSKPSSSKSSRTSTSTANAEDPFSDDSDADISAPKVSETHADNPFSDDSDDSDMDVPAPKVKAPKVKTKTIKKASKEKAETTKTKKASKGKKGKRGKIRVSRATNGYKGKLSYARTKDKSYEMIEVVSRSKTEYKALSPFVLKDSKGRIMENVWQFSKVYASVPKVNHSKWTWPAETHLKSDKLTKKYKRWRKKGMKSTKPVRFPVGRNYRNKCLYALKEKEDGTFDPEDQLEYIVSRKQIYVPLYTELARQQPEYKKLLKIVKSGQNVSIVDFDGPHQDSLDYYTDKYKVKNTFITNNSMLATSSNLDIMLNDPKHPFGHGYCLALALIEDCKVKKTTKAATKTATKKRKKQSTLDKHFVSSNPFSDSD